MSRASIAPKQSENSAVSVIEGIGPSAKQSFRHIGVHKVSDLMRLTVRDLHRAVRPLASYEEVRGWRIMAFLIQVEGVDGQWAEALYTGGIESIEKFQLQSIESLEEIFNEAVAASVCRNAPNSSLLATMLRDAAILHYTGVFYGQVVDEDGNPVSQATVRIGGVRSKSDSAGRFRLLRIRLGSLPPLEVKHPGHQLQRIDNPGIAVNSDVISRRQIVLKKARRSDASKAPVLSELDGDRMPSQAGIPMRVALKPQSEIRSGDIFNLHRFYRNSPHAKLVSKFRTYVDGTFAVTTVKVPLVDLPDDAQLNDHFRYRRGRFSKIELTPRRLQQEIIERMFKKRHPTRKSRRTAEASRELVDALMAVPGRKRTGSGRRS